MAKAKRQVFEKSAKKSVTDSESDDYSVPNSSPDLDMSFLAGEKEENQIAERGPSAINKKQ